MDPARVPRQHELQIARFSHAPIFYCGISSGGVFEYQWGPFEAHGADAPAGTRWVVMYTGQEPSAKLFDGAPAGYLPTVKDKDMAFLRAFELAVGELHDWDSVCLLPGTPNPWSEPTQSSSSASSPPPESVLPFLEKLGAGQEIATLYNLIGEVYEKMTAKALFAYDDSFRTVTKYTTATARGEIGTSMNMLGMALRRAGYHDAAEACYRYGLIQEDVPAEVRGPIADG